MSIINIIALLSRWVHILSVVVAIGGSIFMRFALMPAADESLSAEQHGLLRAGIMKRWRMAVHTCVALLLITGSFNFYMTFRDGVKPIPYHPIFGLKLILAFTVFYYAIALTSSSPGFARLREQRRKWLGVQIALAVAAILVSGVLKAIHQAAIAAGSS